MKISRKSFLLSMIVTIFVGATVGSSIATADSWKKESEHGQHSKHWKHKEKHRGHHRGPPPWAPVYHDDRDESRPDDGTVISVSTDYNKVTTDIGINTGTCNRKVLGTLVGGVIGGIVGHELGDNHKNEEIATIAGAVFGAILGHTVGERMDKTDTQCVGQTLERASDGEWVEWDNKDSKTNYRVSPTETFETNGRYCRKYLMEVNNGGNVNRQQETACRNNDGSWENARISG